VKQSALPTVILYKSQVLAPGQDIQVDSLKNPDIPIFYIILIMWQQATHYHYLANNLSVSLTDKSQLIFCKNQFQ
jgi:hypothetical protein